MIESDAELVQRTLTGDVAAYEVLVRRYERTVRSVALAFLPDVHDSEDIAQETFVEAHRGLAGLRDVEKFGPWLMQIARRTAGKHVAARRRTPLAFGVDPESAAKVRPAPSTVEDPRSARLLASLARLPEHERLVISLRYFDGHTSDEIAAMTGRPLRTVTKQLSRAYARLRRWIVEEEENCRERSRRVGGGT